MPELVPIRVILRRGRKDKNGKPTVWPDFSKLDEAARGGKLAHDCVEQDGCGWCLDKIDNLGTGAATGTAMTLVPAAFANAAAAMYPGDVNIVTEAEFQTFHDTRHQPGIPDELRSAEPLRALLAEKDARLSLARDTIEVDAEIAKALDPDDPTPGVRRNPEKRTYAEMKAARNITIRP